MQKWEYDLLVQSPNTECARCEEALNGLGRDGWELVTFYVNGAGDNVFVFKKPEAGLGLIELQPMSLMGRKRTWRLQFAMSALPPKADIRPRDQVVCFGPITDISSVWKVMTTRRYKPS
jgi:hypothetical protein